MNKTEIAETLRNEVGHLEVAIQKLQSRCEQLKALVLDLEAEIAVPEVQQPKPLDNPKFRKMVDRVFGEKPRRGRR